MQALSLNPDIISFGPIHIRWYGLMYVISFFIGGHLLKKLSREKFFPIREEEVDMFVTLQLIAMFFGARLTYVFVHNWDYFSQHLNEILSVWEGGLSFHGALLGFVIVNYFYSKRKKIPYFTVTDSLALAGTQGLFFGRIGNFINGELFGRVTDVPWGMIFKGGGPYPRHPSQLYEALGEGILLFLILWLLKRKVKIYGIISATFLAGYGSIRFMLEYFREPDAQLGLFYNNNLSMGQILCVIMIIAGFDIFVLSILRFKTPLVNPAATSENKTMK